MLCSVSDTLLSLLYGLSYLLSNWTLPKRKEVAIDVLGPQRRSKLKPVAQEYFCSVELTKVASVFHTEEGYDTVTIHDARKLDGKNKAY